MTEKLESAEQFAMRLTCFIVDSLTVNRMKPRDAKAETVRLIEARDATIALAAKRELLDELEGRYYMNTSEWPGFEHLAAELRAKYTTTEPAQEAPRAIVVGSMWMFNGCLSGNPTPGLRIVKWSNEHTVQTVYVDDSTSGTQWSPLDFFNLHTWVSDPTEPAAELRETKT